MKNKLKIGVLLLTASMLAGTGVSVAAGTDSAQPSTVVTAHGSDDTSVEKLSKEDEDLLKSNKPKTIVTDVVTAKILSVTVDG